MFRRLIVGLGSGLVLCGCAAGPERDPNWASRPAAAIEADAFSGYDKLLSGFDEPLPASEMHRGDQVLYGLRLTKRGRTRDWFVSVEVQNPEHQRHRTRSGREHFTLLVDVRVYDESGDEIGHDSVLMTRMYLVRGLVRACRGDPDEPPGPPPPKHFLFGNFTWTEVMRASSSLRTMLRVIRKSEVMQDVFWEVIDKPSIFSVIGKFGIKVSLKAKFAEARTVAAPKVWRDAATFELPVQLTVNGAPALRCKFFVTEPKSPLNLCAGVIAITAWHPRDPDTVLRMRLLAARRAKRASK